MLIMQLLTLQSNYQSLKFQWHLERHTCLRVFHLQRCFYCTCLPRNSTVLNTSKCLRNLFVIFVEKQRQSYQVHTEYLLHCKLLLRPSLGFVRFNEVKPSAQCFLLSFVNFGSTSFSWGSALQRSLYHCNAISFSLSVQLLQEQQSLLQ